MFMLKLIFFAFVIQDLDSPPHRLSLLVAELQKDLVLDEIDATEEQRIKLRLLDKRQREKQKSINSLQSRMNDHQFQRQMEAVEELSIELAMKSEAMHRQGIKMLGNILNEQQLTRARQIVNWQRCRDHGKKNLVVGICTKYGSRYLNIDGKELYRLKTRFARNHAEFVDHVIGYRRSMESVISPEKLKQVWRSDHVVKLATMESREAVDYFAENFQGGVVAETVVATIHGEAQAALQLLKKRDLSNDKRRQLEREIFASTHKRLAQKIVDREFRRLSCRFLRKCLQDFKNRSELNPDAAIYFGLSDEQVAAAQDKYGEWKRRRNEEYAEFQIQQLQEFKAAITQENLDLLETHFGDLPKSALAYFEKIDP